MGVTGLATLIQLNKDKLLEKTVLQDTKLIIDGNNLACFIYEELAIENEGQNSCVLYGGNYHGFGQAVKKFFTVLGECNVEPIVIMDGGDSKTESKNALIDDRFSQKLTNLVKLMSNEYGSSESRR